LDSDQELYSMLDRGMEKSMLPYCEQNNMAFLAYSPLAQGLLTGKVTPGREFDENDQRNRKERFTPENRRKVLTMLDEFRPIAEAHDITLAQLAIAWTAAQPGCTHVLCGARSPEQVRENAVGGEVELSEQELATINAAIAKFAKEIP
jgi:methylglyoxal reductase